MTNDTVGLRPIRGEDLTFLQQVISDPEDVGSFMWQGFRDPREWQLRFEHTSNLVTDQGGEVMITVGDEPAGSISWSQHQWFGRPCWSLGIQLARSVRGRGIGTRAHQLLVAYLFASTTRDRIEAYTEWDNVAERRALEKAGFELEGTIRHAGFRDGQWRDGVLFSIIR